MARALRDEPREGGFGTFHMAAGGDATWADLARAVMEASREAGGPSATVTGIATAAYPTPAPRPANSRLDCARLEGVFDVSLPHWKPSQQAIVRRLLAKHHVTELTEDDPQGRRHAAGAGDVEREGT